MVSWGLSENDVSPVLTPLFHAGGLFAFMTPLLYAGGRIILAKGFDAEQSLRVIQDEALYGDPGRADAVPNVAGPPGFAPADFSAVHFFISGGAPLPVPLVEAWRHSRPWFSARATA